VAATEDGNTYHCRHQAAGTEPNDDVDDATDVWLPCFIISQRPVSFLGDFKCCENLYTILCDWVGRPRSNSSKEDS